MVYNKKLNRINLIGSIIRGRFYQVNRHIIAPILKTEFKWKQYYGRKILESKEGNEYLIQLIKSNKPFMAGRFGTSECRAFVRKLEIDMGFKNKFDDRLDVMCNNAGFFPHDEKLLNRYCEFMADCYSDTDLLGIMNILGEDFVVHNFLEKAQLTTFLIFDPINWSYVLEGKNVLVVHSMAETIRSQYNNRRSQIYVGSNILPEFNLQTVRAVQTAAGEVDNRFSTWFDALEFMQQEIEKKEFDIALIGAGAYGFPLAVHVKRMGKQAIHVGAPLQLLFGIKGSRWDNNESYKKYFNEAWVRPNKSEIPQNYKNVEGGCYW